MSSRWPRPLLLDNTSGDGEMGPALAVLLVGRDEGVIVPCRLQESRPFGENLAGVKKEATKDDGNANG